MFARADVVACAACDLLFVSPRPTAQAIAAFYSRPGHYDRWDADDGRPAMWQRRLARVRERVACGRLLDVGGGQGDFGAAAARHYDVTMTEVSSEGARQARDRHGLSMLVGDLLELDLPAGSFDAITMWHVLEHVARPRALVEACARLLRPGGTLFVAVPNTNARMQLLRRRVEAPLRGALGRPPRGLAIAPLRLEDDAEEIHLTHFTLDTLARLIEAASLRVIARGIDDHSPSSGRQARGWHRCHVVCHRLTGVAVAPAIFAAATRTR